VARLSTQPSVKVLTNRFMARSVPHLPISASKNAKKIARSMRDYAVISHRFGRR
jgi:hypothetical protein